MRKWIVCNDLHFYSMIKIPKAISKTIMFDIQPELFLDDKKIDSVVMDLLNNHQRDLLSAMKNVSTFIMRL